MKSWARGVAALAGTLIAWTGAAPVQAASQLGIEKWNWSVRNGRFEVWADVKNYEAQGSSGSIRIEMRLATAPHDQQGRYWTVGVGNQEAGIPAGYAKRYSASAAYNPASFPAGSKYVTIDVQEYTRGGWSHRAQGTSGTMFTVQAAAAPPPPPATRPPAQGPKLALGQWGWQVNNGQASVQAKIGNSGGAKSGTLRMELKFCTQPFGQGGSCYMVAKSGNLQPLDGGYDRSGISFSGATGRYDPGSYHVVLVLKEYTGQGDDGYAIRDGGTSTSLMRIGGGPAGAPPPGAGRPPAGGGAPPAADDSGDDDDDDEGDDDDDDDGVQQPR